MYLKVEVITEAKEEYVKKIGSDSFVVSVREKAEQNMANRRVLELIRKEFGGGARLPKTGNVGQGVLVKIISGHHSPRKILSVEMKNPPRGAGLN